MKKISISILLLLCLAIILPATNTTSSSKGFMVDQTGGWWRGETKHYAKQIITVDYTKGNGTSITLTAGARFTDEICLVNDVTYALPIIDSAGNVTSDPITISTSGSYVFTVGIQETADYIYVKVEYTGGTTATVNINQAPEVPRRR